MGLLFHGLLHVIIDWESLGGKYNDVRANIYLLLHFERKRENSI